MSQEMESKKPKSKTKKSFVNKILFALFPPRLPTMIPLPLIIGKESPAQGTYLMLALMAFDNVTLDNRTMTVAIVTDEEDEVLLAEIGWEKESFYLNTGYSLEEAHRLRFGLLIEKNENIDFAAEVFKQFRKMVAKNPIFTDYVKEQHRKFKTMQSKDYGTFYTKTMKKLDTMERKFKI